MALTKCRECGGQVSTEAASCPHCGVLVKVDVPRETVTTKVMLKQSNGMDGLSFILGLVGFILLFMLPPVGLLMLMAAGALGYFGKSKVPSLQGACPHCGKLLTLPEAAPGSACPACAKRFIKRDDKFVAV